jgi:hypothetical protein
MASRKWVAICSVMVAVLIRAMLVTSGISVYKQNK